ncbi:RICIN domain-containing protein [Streptomyces sp. NPDC005303]|uniref:RICIN domain-containing protein n=1 Tax=Streptomyces sp. NPDC005303 TaxID=3155713 RepID=UPI0033AC1B35
MRRTPAVPALAAALAAGSLIGLVDSPAQAAAGPTVSVWETTADQSTLLAAQTSATFTSGAGSGSQTITIHPDTTYQTMSGFGVSLTDSSADLIANSPQRESIMRKLFDPSAGIGLSFLRQPIGASDFSLSTYSYDDMPSGQADPTLANFSIAHDNNYILPVLRQALALNPATTVMASPWSPPGWMKSSGSMVGGSLNAASYSYFANYLVKFLQAYEAAGVPVSLLTPQNEPEYSPGNYPGSTLTAGQQATLIGSYLGPAIKAAGLSTEIVAYDHNWDDAGYPQAILSDSTAAPYVSGVAWHCYAGSPGAQTTVHNARPSTDTYFTECSGTQSSNPANTFSDTLNWQTENLIIGATRNWAKSVVTWNAALNPSGGPSMNCTTCTAAVTVDNSAGTAKYNAEYYVLGQASKFVKPGAVRIDSNTFGSGNIQDVAFQNPDGSHALIVLNADTGNSRTFNVTENGQSFTYTLPAKAVATFTWTPGSTSGGDTTAPSVPSGLTASGTMSSSTTLNWATSTDNVGVSGYQILRNGAQIATTTETSYTDTGLSPSTRYSYTVKAYDAAGNVSGASTPLTVTTSASGTGGGPIDTTKWYTVKNAHSGKCVDAADGATGNGTAVQQWTCAAGNTNQQWQFQATDGGYYKVVSRNATTAAWNVTGGPTATGDGAKIQLWSYGGGTNEQWKPVQNTDGTYTINPRNSTDECLDVTGTSTADGARLQQWTCSGSTNQRYVLTSQ